MIHIIKLSTVFIYLVLSLKVNSQTSTKIDSFFNFQTQGIDFSYSNLNTTDSTISVSLDFESNGKANQQILVYYDSVKFANSEPIKEAPLFQIKNANYRMDQHHLILEGPFPFFSVKGLEINNTFDGIIVLKQVKNHTSFSIFTQTSENDYHYFNFRDGLMQTYSTDSVYNDHILNTPKRKTKFRGNTKKQLGDYQFMLSSKTKSVGFRRKYPL